MQHHDAIPEKNFPVREPKHELVVHLRFILKKFEGRRVQERLEHRVVAADSSVPAKKYIDRSLAQLPSTAEQARPILFQLYALKVYTQATFFKECMYLQTFSIYY